MNPRQSWTTLRELQLSKKYKNVFKMDKYHSGLVSIYTEPQVAIGQRAILCCTDKGNILWDCITYIDDETIQRVKDLGGVEAIVISHPHYYSTSLHWAEAFDCKVYLSSEDQEWIMRTGDRQVLWEDQRLSFLDGEIVAVKTGGHFPGSSVLFWKSAKKLLVADTITVVPSGVYHVDRPPNTASFTFMWSYPNFVSHSCTLPYPLSAADKIRSLFHQTRSIRFGNPLPILILRIPMARSGRGIHAERARKGFWTVRRSLWTSWDIVTTRFTRKPWPLPMASYN